MYNEAKEARLCTIPSSDMEVSHEAETMAMESALVCPQSTIGKSPKKARKLRPCTVLLLRCGERYAIEKRPEKGLLAGLWEFPNVDGHLSADEAHSYAESLGVCPASVTCAGEATHIFTHVEWHMRGYFVECREISPALTWTTPTEIANTYAIPKAFRFYTEQL